LNRAFPLFEEAMQRDPANRNFRTNYILYSESVADLYLASKSPTAARARLEKLRQDITPPDLSLAVLRRIAGTVRHKLAMLAIERRDPEAALSIARESLAIAENFEKSEKASSERLVRFTAYATMGEVLSARRSPEAKAWLDRAIAGYTSLQKDPSFRPFHRETLRLLRLIRDSLTRP
jgi:tetratricopeptide (TPR) repeat protein